MSSRRDVMISTVAISSGQHVAGRTAARARLVRGPLWTSATVVVLVVGGAGLALSLAGVVPGAPPGPTSSWHQDAGLALGAVALVLLVVAAVRTARAGWASASGWVHGPTSSREQRAQALRAVRGNQAVPEPATDLTVAVAGATAGQGRAAPLWVALALVLAGGAPGMATWWLAVTMSAVAAMAVLAVITTWDARAARRWLDTHHHAPPTLGSVR